MTPSRLDRLSDLLVQGLSLPLFGGCQLLCLWSFAAVL